MNGRKRRVTDEQVKRIREWKPITQLAREFGISPARAYAIRGANFRHKQPQP